MTRTSRSSRRLVLYMIASLLLVWVWLGAVTSVAAQAGEPFNGTFTNTFMVGPACADSPILMCTRGLLKDEQGNDAGIYDFSFDSQFPNLRNPTEIFFTGHSKINKVSPPAGILFGTDHGTLHIDLLTLTGTFTTYVDIIGGEGPYDGAGGQIVANGKLSFVTGMGSGTYQGTIFPAGP